MMGIAVTGFVYFIILAVIIYVSYIVARKFEKIAIMKGYNENIHSFAMCFWLGIIGYLYVIALPDLHTLKKRNETGSANIDGTVYRCPICEEIVAKGTNKCSRCGHVFEWNR